MPLQKAMKTSILVERSAIAAGDWGTKKSRGLWIISISASMVVYLQGREKVGRTFKISI